MICMIYMIYMIYMHFEMHKENLVVVFTFAFGQV